MRLKEYAYFHSLRTFCAFIMRSFLSSLAIPSLQSPYGSATSASHDIGMDEGNPLLAVAGQKRPRRCSSVASTLNAISSASDSVRRRLTLCNRKHLRIASLALS